MIRDFILNAISALSNIVAIIWSSGAFITGPLANSDQLFYSRVVQTMSEKFATFYVNQHQQIVQWRRYSTISFLQKPCNRHPIARWWGRYIGCLLWLQTLDLCFATISVSVVLHIISCYHIPWYSGTQSYINPVQIHQKFLPLSEYEHCNAVFISSYS